MFDEPAHNEHVEIFQLHVISMIELASGKKLDMLSHSKIIPECEEQYQYYDIHNTVW